jgi:hypothetical protein
MNRALFAFALCCLALLTGCAAPSGPISLSISELGSEVQEDAGSLFNSIDFKGIRHRRSHNVTGLGSAETVGMLSTDPDPPLLFRWPSLFSRKTLPDQMAPRISSECSRVVVHDLPMAQGKGIKEVLDLRDSLDQLHAVELRLQRIRAQAALLDEIVASFESAAAAEAAASAASASDARAQRSAKDRDLLIGSWRRLSPSLDAPSDKDGWRERRASLVSKQGEVQKEFDTAEAEFRAARRVQGLVVARWEYEASSKGGLEAIGTSASASQAQSRTGFVVIGHPRTLTLISGDDLMSRACHAQDADCDIEVDDKRTGIDTMIPVRRLYTTTFQMLAEHLAWAESGTVAQQAAFAVQLSEITKTVGAAGLGSLKGRLEALNIEIGFGSRASMAGENLGAISGSTHWEVPFSFWGDKAYARSVEYLRLMNGKFLRVSSMRTTLDAYAKRYGVMRPTNEKHCRDGGPSQDEVWRMTRIHLACDRLNDGEFVHTLDAGDLAQRHEACSTPPPVRAGTQAAMLEGADR